MGVELSVLFSGSPCCDCSTSSASAFCASAEIRNLFWSQQLSCVLPVADQVPELLVPSSHVTQSTARKHALVCFIWLGPPLHPRHALLNQGGNLSSWHRPSYFRPSLLDFWCVQVHDVIALDSPVSYGAALPKGYASAHTAWT
jgi:hypothetical protein